MSYSEIQLLELAKSGDVQAFDGLVAAHQDRVYRLAYRMLGNSEDAADVQQESFVKAWQSLRKFRQNAAFSTWLHRITVNLCISRKRVRSVEEYQLDENMHAASPSMVSQIERTETALQVRKVLAAMPAHHRAPIVLRDLEERSFEEVAEIFGCSIESARTRVCKARKLFRERMLPYLAEEMQ